MARVTIPLRQVAANRLITHRALNDAWNPEVLVEQTIDGVLLAVSTKVMVGGPERHRWYADVPASWFQHFKRDVLVPLTKNPSTPIGRWLHVRANRVGIKTTSGDIDCYTRVCPHIAVPDSSSHVEFLQAQE